MATKSSIHIKPCNIASSEVHNLIGAGRTGEGSMDASNMLKPYLETEIGRAHV